MNYDTWKATDVMGDEQEADSRRRGREEEEAREQQWANFISWLKAKYLVNLWPDAVHDALDAYISDDEDVDDYRVKFRDFAGIEGWDSVLIAISCALKEPRS